MSELTKQEEDLLKRLSPPPKCMHLDNIIDCGDSWLCNCCGIRSGKRSLFATLKVDNNSDKVDKVYLP